MSAGYAEGERQGSPRSWTRASPPRGRGKGAAHGGRDFRFARREPVLGGAPGRRVAPGLVPPQRLCTGEEPPHRRTVADQTVCAGLDEDVAERGGLRRAGHDRQPAGVGRQLAQELVAGTAADDVDDVDRVVGEGLRLADRPAVGEGGDRECNG